MPVELSHHFSTIKAKKNAIIPFKDHPQFSILVDILSRKAVHHVCLHTDFSTQWLPYFLEAFLQHLAHEPVPPMLHEVELLYLHAEHLTPLEKKQIENDLQKLQTENKTSKKCLLIAVSHPAILDMFSVEHPAFRFIIFTSKHILPGQLEKYFSCLSLTSMSESDKLSLLKHQCIELENFHNVVISEEIISQAYLLAERYLSATHALEKTLLLLDSSTARASAAGELGLTLPVVLNVLSTWTQIPASHLQTNRFKPHEFIQAMQQRVFGQEAALTVLAQALQQSQANLQQRCGPFCGLWLVGGEHTGKRTTALALTEQLFKQLNVLYLASAITINNSMFEMKLKRCVDKQYLPLKEVLTQTPYAVILFENMEHAAPTLIEALQEIIQLGVLHDEQGNILDFRQSILLFSTTIGANRLAELTVLFSPEEGQEEVNFMQLIMKDLKPEPRSAKHDYSPQELVDVILPEMTAQFPLSLCQQVPMLPFLPLTKLSIEKIIRLK